MSEVSPEGLRVNLRPEVNLGQPDTAECIVHVQGSGSYKVDEPTFDFLQQLSTSGDGYLSALDVTLRPELVASLGTLQGHGIVNVSGDVSGLTLGHDSHPTHYSGELADLVLRRDLTWLSSVLNTIGAPLARIWSLRVVIVLGATLPTLLLGGAIWFNFQAAYEAWFKHPLVVMLLTIIATLLTGLLHEAGHVAAARRHGLHNPACGVGFYVHRPVFYVDVTAIDTHPRLSRVHVDLGGIAMDGLTLLLAVIAVRVWFADSGVAYAVVSAMAMASLAPLNPATKSDLNWCGRDLLGARGLATSWGRPRDLLHEALSGSDERERRFARLLLTASLVSLFVIAVAGLRSAAAIGPILREARTDPISLAPILVVWSLTLLGIMATLRAVRRQATKG